MKIRFAGAREFNSHSSKRIFYILILLRTGYILAEALNSACSAPNSVNRFLIQFLIDIEIIFSYRFEGDFVSSFFASYFRILSLYFLKIYSNRKIGNWDILLCTENNLYYFLTLAM